MFRYLFGTGVGKLYRHSQMYRISSFVMIITLIAARSAVAESYSSEMTLAAAAKRVMSQNPQLQVYRFRNLGAKGMIQMADQNPALEFGVDIENFAGSGDFNGSDSAEITLALSSVIELGDKRQARVAAASARQRLIEAERQVAALDLMGELTRRFVDVVASQARLELAINTQLLAKETTASVKRRVDAGAAPEAELLRARAEYARTEITVNKEQSQQHSSRVSLSLLWGEAEPNFVRGEWEFNGIRRDR